MTARRKSGEGTPRPIGTGVALGRSTASSALIRGQGVKADAAKVRADQQEAQLMFAAVGEVRKAVTARGALLSACGFSIGLVPTRDDDEGRPLFDEEGVPLDPSIPAAAIEVAETALASLVDVRGSQGSLIDATSQNWDITGEAYLCGWWVDDTGRPVEESDEGALRQRWEVVGTGAYRIEGRRHFIRLTRDGLDIQLPDSAYVVRTWKRHPVWADEAHGWVMSALPSCRSLLAYSLAERSQALSSAVGSIYLVPSEAAPAKPVEAGLVPNDDAWLGIDECSDLSPADEWAAKLDRMIADVIGEVLDDWQSGRAVQGGVLAVEAKFIEYFGKTIDIGRTIDSALGEQTERALQRLREQADCSPEMISGLGETNRWNGKQIDESDYRRYHRPQIEAIAEAWTSEVIRPALAAAGVPFEVQRKLTIVVNKTAIVAPPDRSKIAGEALRNGAIGWEGYRQLCDIPDRFKPSDEELAAMQAFWQSQPSNSSTTSGSGSGSGSNPPDEVAPVNEAAGALQPPRLVAAASNEVPLGDLLIEIERASREALEAAGAMAFDTALARANGKARNLARKHLRVEAPEGTSDVLAWLGPDRVSAVLTAEFGSDSDSAWEELIAGALVAFRKRYSALADRYHDRTLGALRIPRPSRGKPSRSPFTGQLIRLEELVEAVEAGWSHLTESLIEWVREAAESEPGVIPDSVWRRVLSVLGGNEVKPGAGPAATGAASEATAGVFGPMFSPLEPPAERFVWNHYLVKANPFPQHMALDGAVISGRDDPILAGAPWGSYWPGDHHGCLCDVVPEFSTDTDTEGA